MAIADDGEKVMKVISDKEAVVDGYVDEAEHAFTGMMKFYVPAQAANGTISTETTAGGLEYFYNDGDDVADEIRGLAKPLVNVFMDGPEEGVDGTGFAGHGLRDAFAAVSLDDGVTWKDTNLSESAAESSIDIVRDDIPLFTDAGLVADGTTAYPGDVTNMFHAIAGNKVVVAWPSKFCSQGQPNYSLDGVDDETGLLNTERRAAIATYLGIDLATASPDDLYLIDMYGVAGNQGTIDYLDDKWEENHPAGEVPFSCLWTARGELIKGDDPRTGDVTEASFMRWFNTERLTSGTRDVNRVEVMGVAGAGFAITWQEDPDGLRPGQGEGPGEGWSGAIANSGTDVWYSYIDIEDFSIVQDPTVEDGTAYLPLTGDDFTATEGSYEALALDPEVTQKPKPFVPFAMPMRVTDNEKCNVENPKPYCYGSALAEYTDPDTGPVPVPQTTDGIELNPLEYGLDDMCESIIEVVVGKNDDTSLVCITEDGLPMLGNTAATRPRLGLYGYDSTGKVKDAVIDNAFATVIFEEDKGLGKFGFMESEDGTVDYTVACDPDADPAIEGCVPFDEGKSIWYNSFSMSLTDDMVSEDLDGLLDNLGSHGNMLNQPEVNWRTGEFFGDASTEYLWNFSDATPVAGDAPDEYSIYNTEIARRGSWLGQDIYKVHNATSKAKDGLLALPTWKQGTMNSGGPADVMSRQIIIPDGWNLRSGGPNGGNPYAFRNMACETWAFQDGSNAQYPEGVCLESPINLSGSIPDTCVDSETGEAIACPAVDLTQGTFGVGDTNPILQGNVLDDGDETTKDSNTTEALTWHQCPADYSSVELGEDTVAPLDCDTDARTDDSTLRDQSWYNPLDVAKGHRGFLDGDMVMMLYAWSPNWRLNAKGSDRYELYIRRSFDGAGSWTNTPGNYTHWDGTKYTGEGTVVCESYRSDETQASGDLVEPQVCYTYDATKDGADEQARNVTQHKSMSTTTLDPRFAMTGSPQGVNVTSDLFGYGLLEWETAFGDNEDVRDPSRFFVVYETGDNTTTQFGEPEPLDLFYSRAVNFGDDYVVWDELAESTRDGSRDVTDCYPNAAHEDDDVVGTVLEGSGFCNEFDKMESGTPGLEASEASMTANPGGQFLYAVWAQAQIIDGALTESDAMARRVWWVDDFFPVDAWVFGQGSGDGGDSTAVTRVGGQDRIDTAILLSQERFEADSAGAVVLARSDDYADALAAVPLTKRVDAPLLITPVGLSSRVDDEIERVLPAGGTVIIVGGTGAIAASTETALVAQGYEVERISGVDRYETAVAVAEKIGTPQSILVASGRNFPDALASGPAAARVNGVVVLTADTTMPAVTAEYLASQPGVSTFAVGGPAAAVAPELTPIVGEDRYETARLVAEEFFESPVGVGVASSQNFPDALSGGADAAAQEWPLLLTAKDALNNDTADYISGSESVVSVDVYGGPVVISDAVVDALSAAMR
ncbi:choice-of-anchor O protein [Ornithinimicrobium sp. LYQ103]|uniref:choice-of-anchor O protein n=1 Tax=Ornithinimicrobium sp. LYQ103 TaxID=3378796 RepID=UPI003862179C